MNIFEKAFASIRRFFAFGSSSVRINHSNSYSYWQQNSIYVDNIFNKISTDVAMMKFRHITTTKSADGLDVVSEIQSDLADVLTIAPNEFETPIVFWSNVVRKMLQEQVCVVVPKYQKDKLVELVIADFVNFEDRNVIVNIGDDKEVILDIGSVWIFENPKKNISSQLGQITKLIDENLRLLSYKLSEQGNSLKGFLKLPNRVADEVLKKRAEARINDMMNIASGSGIGYLEQGESFQELNNEYSTVSEKELEFLKMQLYQAFGINENLFTCSYSEEQYRAYYSSVLKVYKRVIEEEINRKYFTKTSRTLGHKLLCYFDMFDITSLKELSEFCFKQKYSGVLNANETRQIVTAYGGFPLSAYEGGDVFETNKNAVRIGEGEETE